MTDKDQRMTDEAADSTAAGLLAWDALLVAWDEADGDAEEARWILNRAKLAGGEGWQIARDALALADEYDALDEDGPRHAFDSSVLDAYAEARVGMDGTTTLNGMVYLLGFGGPNIRATYEDGDTITVSVDWWGSHARRTVTAPALAAWMDADLDTLGSFPAMVAR